MKTVEEMLKAYPAISKRIAELISSRPYILQTEARDSNWLFDQSLAFERDNQYYRFSLVRDPDYDDEGYRLITEDKKFLLVNRELSESEAYSL